MVGPPNNADELLERMSISAAPGLYCFGYRHALLSIRAQQVRALNLAAALHEKSIIPRVPVVVIGAGVAGLTLAAATVELGGRAVVVDHALAPMGNLRNATHRYLHPNMLRWPDPDWDNPDAEMPLLNWSADWGNRVWEHLWNSVEPYINRGMSLELPSQNIQVTRDGTERWRATWTFREENKHESDAIVVLALGPGHESTDYGSPRYWDQDQEALDQEAHGQRILVSGTGDGGLIDAIRRCLFDRQRLQRIDHLTLLRMWVIHSRMDANGVLEISRQAILGHLWGSRWDTPKVPVDLLLRASSDLDKGGCVLSQASCGIHRDLIDALVDRGAIRKLCSSIGLPAFKYHVETATWRAQCSTDEVSPPFKDEGYHRIYVRHGPSDRQRALETIFRDASCEIAEALLSHVSKFRELEQPLSLFGDMRSRIGTVAAPKQRLSWPHHAGDLFCEVQKVRNRLSTAEALEIEETSAEIYNDLLGRHPERATWLHADLGRPDPHPSDLRDTASKIAGVIRELMHGLIRGSTNAPRWVVQLLTSGSLCSRERGVLLPPKSGLTPIWVPDVSPEISVSYARACGWDEWPKLENSSWPTIIEQQTDRVWRANNAVAEITIVDLVTVEHGHAGPEQKNVVRYIFSSSGDLLRFASEMGVDHAVLLT